MGQIINGMIKVRSTAIRTRQPQGKEESQGHSAGGTACTFLTRGAQSDKEMKGRLSEVNQG